MAKTDESRDEGLFSYDSFGSQPAKRSSGGSSFLWWCAGAHQRILKDYPSEHTKYSGLGGVLLATFALAVLSGGYAVYTIFNNYVWAVVFGLLWGLIIFNFDRFLVSTMRKYGLSKDKQWLMAVPRIILAVLIGITIARPLELKIFEKEINIKMVENMHHKIKLNDSLLNAENKLVIQTAESERSRLSLRRQALEDSLRMLQSAYVSEADGTGGSGKRGIEQLTRMKKDAYDAALATYTPELKQVANEMRVQDSILSDARANNESKRKDYASTAVLNQGFLERNKALSDLSDDEPSVWWTSLLVSLLIIMIEVGPVFSKLIMPTGPYDIALAKEELLLMAENESEIRKGKELLYAKRKSFYDKQKIMSEELVDKLTELQKKNIDIELDKWERGEWTDKDHRPSMDEVLRKIKKQYEMDDDNLL